MYLFIFYIFFLKKFIYFFSIFFLKLFLGGWGLGLMPLFRCIYFWGRGGGLYESFQIIYLFLYTFFS